MLRKKLKKSWRGLRSRPKEVWMKLGKTLKSLSTSMLKSSKTNMTGCRKMQIRCSRKNCYRSRKIPISKKVLLESKHTTKLMRWKNKGETKLKISSTVYFRKFSVPMASILLSGKASQVCLLSAIKTNMLHFTIEHDCIFS